MKYYVVTDVHGYAEECKRALTEKGFFEEKEPSMLVVCGDLLDRGPEAETLVEFMLDIKEQGRLVYILGNHEDLFVDCLQAVARGDVYDIASGLSHHYINKTWDSLLALGGMSEQEAYTQPHELVRSVMRSSFYKKLLPSAVDYFETPHYIFTHGWIPCVTKGPKPYTSYRYDPDWREADAIAWRRARWFNGMEVACKHHVAEEGKTIVCGHWHTSYGHAHLHGEGSEWGKDAVFAPFHDDGIIALDACTAYSGTVNCIVIED